LLAAGDFKRLGGVLFLVVVLPDGSPGTIRADATDVLGEVMTEPARLVMDAEGLRVLRRLVSAGGAVCSGGRGPGKTNRFDPP
jgi:hypothetical protein